LFLYGGGAMPASLELVLDADKTHEGEFVFVESVFLTYDDGQNDEIVRSDAPRAGVFTIGEYDGKEYCHASIGIPDCVCQKQDYRLSVSGYILSNGKKKPFKEEAGVIYSENSYIVLGWVPLLLYMSGV
jgi:hypothetical protein